MITARGMMTPIPIWTPCGRPPCWGSAVAVPPEVSVGSGGGGCSAAVEVVLAGALVVDVTGDVVVPVLDEDGVLLDDEEDDVERVVVVETVALDTLMRLSPTQNGPSISPPPQVCPSAQHMLPHWKSPTAQTRVQPAVSAPAEQQRKAPLSREHVSPAAPSSKWLVSAPVLGTRGWRFFFAAAASDSQVHLQHQPACGHVDSLLPQAVPSDCRFQRGREMWSPETAGHAARNRNAAGAIDIEPAGS
jgi:hypothetical protein